MTVPECSRTSHRGPSLRTSCTLHQCNGDGGSSMANHASPLRFERCFKLVGDTPTLIEPLPDLLQSW